MPRVDLAALVAHCFLLLPLLPASADAADWSSVAEARLEKCGRGFGSDHFAMAMHFAMASAFFSFASAPFQVLLCNFVLENQ